MLHIWALKIKKVPWLPRRSILLDGPDYWSSKNDMFQPSFTHTLSEINEITLWLRFVFYFSLSRSVWAVGCSASPAGATCGQPGRPDLPLGYVWWEKPAFTGKGKTMLMSDSLGGKTYGKIFCHLMLCSVLPYSLCRSYSSSTIFL